MPGLQSFAAAGLTKRVILPTFYLGVIITSFWPFSPQIRSAVHAKRARYPVWWWLLYALVAVSSFLAIADPRQDTARVDVAQGAALLGGFLLTVRLGLMTGPWTDRARLALADVVVAASTTAAVLDVSLLPFESLRVPGMAAAAYLAIRLPARRRVYAVASALMALAFVRTIVEASAAHPLSIAVIAQAIVGVGIVVIGLMRPARRLVVASAGLLVAVLFLAHHRIFALLVGAFDYEDVTLAHRGYETASVRALVEDDLVSTLFGLGPGATVDLSLSPDAHTLAASGRDLFHVDDVHLFTSYVYLKLGVLGLLWIALVYFSTVKVSTRVLRVKTLDPWLTMLVIYIAAGVASALPAATNFFADPLTGLLLGVLLAQYPRRVHTDQQQLRGKTRDRLSASAFRPIRADGVQPAETCELEKSSVPGRPPALPT